MPLLLGHSFCMHAFIHTASWSSTAEPPGSAARRRPRRTAMPAASLPKRRMSMMPRDNHAIRYLGRQMQRARSLQRFELSHKLESEESREVCVRTWAAVAML